MTVLRHLYLTLPPSLSYHFPGCASTVLGPSRALCICTDGTTVGMSVCVGGMTRITAAWITFPKAECNRRSGFAYSEPALICSILPPQKPTKKFHWTPIDMTKVYYLSPFCIISDALFCVLSSISDCMGPSSAFFPVASPIYSLYFFCQYLPITIYRSRAVYGWK